VAQIVGNVIRDVDQFSVQCNYEQKPWQSLHTADSAAINIQPIKQYPESCCCYKNPITGMVISL